MRVNRPGLLIAAGQTQPTNNQGFLYYAYAPDNPTKVTFTAYAGAAFTSVILNVLTGDESGLVNTGGKVCDCAGGPIDLSSANVWLSTTEYSIPGIGGGLSLKRT